MHYWQSYRFVFTSPKGGTNWLLASVCMIIPMVGGIVVIGYLFEVIDSLLWRHGRGSKSLDPASGELVMDALPARQDLQAAPYPDFNFNRFTEYLTRGIWPFLVYLIVNMGVGVLMSFFMMIGLVIGSIISASTNSPWGMAVFWVLFIPIQLILATVAGIAVTPLYLRAGLSCDFSSSFSMEFWRDFFKRVGKETVLAHLFIAATGTVLSACGLVLCYFPAFLAMALTQFAHHHLDFQLYELYLERGGTPVERKPKDIDSQTLPREEDYAQRVMAPPPDVERSTDVMRPDEGVQ
jgi:hypothetical protein